MVKNNFVGKEKKKQRNNLSTTAKDYFNTGNITQNWVNILIPYAEDYSSMLSGSEIARRAKIPQQTVSRKLNEMCEMGILRYAREGRNKKYYLDLQNSIAKNILNIIENHRSLLFAAATPKIKPAIEEITKYAETAAIFGSYAKGKEDSKSDLDILILGKCDKKKISKIKNKSAVEINEKYAGYAEFKKMLESRNALAIEIAENHIIFGNISNWIDILVGWKNGRG